MDTQKTSNQFNSQLEASAKQQIEDLSERLLEVIALYKLGKSLNFSFQMDNILNDSEEFMKNSLRIEEFSIFLLDSKGKKMTMWKANHTTYDTTKDVMFEIGEGITGLVAQKGEPILVRDVSKDKRFLHYKGKKTDIGSFYSLPLRNRKNKVIGVFNIHKKDVDGFNQGDLVLFSETAEHIANAIENSRIFQDIQELAITDELTKLYTRRYFTDALEKEISKAKRQQGFFSVIMVDVDHFKSINDTYGHPTGDAVLKELAHLLKLTTRQEDIIARYGGEEFIILLPGATETDARRVSEKIRSEVEDNLVVEEEKQPRRKVTISAGVSSFPGCGQTSGELLSSVDDCLYFAKNSGRNMVCCASEKSSSDDSIDRRGGNIRQLLSLKVCRGLKAIQFIELNVDGQWKICALDNISKTGFKGHVEFTPPAKGEKIPFRISSDEGSILYDLFDGVLAYKNKISDERYSVGFEVVDKHEKWERLLNRISR